MPDYEYGASPAPRNLGLQCMWWGSAACGFVKKELTGRTGCGGKVDMACLYLLERVALEDLTDWERLQVQDPTLGRRPPEVINGGESQEE